MSKALVKRVGRFDPIRKQRESLELLLERAVSLEVRSEERAQEAQLLLRQIATSRKRIKEKQDLLLKPILEAAKANRKMFGELLQTCDRAREILDQAITKWRQVEKARRESEVAQRLKLVQKDAEKIAKRDPSAARDLVLVAKEDARATLEEPVAKVEGVSFTKRWKFEITNLDFIPRQFWIVDEKALGRVAREMKEKAEVPGVRFYFEEGSAVSAEEES